MELPEEDYEDELIDAFDASEPGVLASTELPNPSPQHRNANLGQARSNVQKFHTKTTNIPALYPTFEDTPKTPEAPVVTAMTLSKLTHQHEKMNMAEVQQHDALPPAQEYSEEQLMSEVELQRRRQQIEREMRVYQEQFDHVAQALAGETPHQIQERKKREEERLGRQEKRYEEMETRLQHQIERLEEREERRARIQARHHRGSRSPSPSSCCEGQDPAEDVGLDKQDKNKG